MTDFPSRLTSPIAHAEAYFPLSLQITARARRVLALPPAPARASHVYQVRALADQLRRQQPDVAGSAGQLELLAVLSGVLRWAAEQHLAARGCIMDMDGVAVAGGRTDLPGLRRSLEAFVQLFPPARVWDGLPPRDFLHGSGSVAGRRQTLLELLVLVVQSGNPAAAAFRPLFDDSELRQQAPYRSVLEALDRALRRVPASGLLEQPLLEMLRAPVLAAPDDLAGQLRYVRRYWQDLLPEQWLLAIDTGLALAAEEWQARGGEPGPVPLPDYPSGRGGPVEEERFSPDRDWMADLVLLAKSIFVWLDQLSRQYQRPISRLRDIPDEELDLLARRGFSGLWLIGIWERSTASRQIKRLRGNPDAAASAYALEDYVIAAELGGQEDLEDLARRCRQRGIRLGCDVVPNHTGIDSRWVCEHPDWFVQTDWPPYPGYRFSGPDLSIKPGISLYIEDGYWDHSDAAVVFQHIDHHSGRVRYIYHGNDGTHLPWNDTAQLNFLLPEVREAMMRTIIHVARNFPIIRFDAAMTLAKKHYQRLWFPLPGGGAGVPSRSEHCLSHEEFERLFPQEFWRELVDRVAAEAPDTLLLAEAFWLMESFFVRTLGMHRVYNSAFMHMLKNEENDRFRQLLKKTLAFNPEILKRFVNFMNNPDEATAVEQFGKGDKYFGVAVVLATLPGLPMFGHGQVEGFCEKYGMEFRRAYWQEAVDEGFVRHHEAQIFPLLHKRYLFSGAEHFALYDFAGHDGVNENVLAYSNRHGAEKALVVYHNCAGEAHGWVRQACERVRAEGTPPERPVLSEALALPVGEDSLCRFRDHASGLEYLRSTQELVERGLFLKLGSYQYHVFLDFTVLHDEDGCWRRLWQELDGRPTADLDRARRRLLYGELLAALDAVLAAGPADPQPRLPRKELLSRYEIFLCRLQQALGLSDAVALPRDRLVAELELWPKVWDGLGQPPTARMAMLLWGYLVLHGIGDLEEALDPGGRALEWLDRFLLDERLAAWLPAATSEEDVALLRLLLRHAPGECLEQPGWLISLLDDEGVRACLQVHRYHGREWFVRERLDELLTAFCLAGALDLALALPEHPRQLADRLRCCREQRAAWLETAARAGYRLDNFRRLLQKP